MQRNPSPLLIAGDASLEAWAIVVRKAGQFGDAFPEDTGLCSSEITRSLMRPGQWRPVRRRAFRQRLERILPGELTAFPRAVAIGAGQIQRVRKRGRGQGVPRRFSRKIYQKMEEVVDQVVYTDNSVCYFATRKGRSSIDKVTALCRFWLLVQVVSRVKIHSRWVSTRLMPADYLTRSEPMHWGSGCS